MTKRWNTFFPSDMRIPIDDAFLLIRNSMVIWVLYCLFYNHVFSQEWLVCKNML